MTDERKEGLEESEEEVPRAHVHVAEWSPWVWVLPALAVLFVGWLVIRYGYFGGGTITVRFAEARGLDRYSPVRYKGAKVGTVQKITIDQDSDEVVVRITMDATMDHALREGTRFWIVEPGLDGGLGGILSGTYVAMAPGDGDEIREFRGQEFAPIVGAPEAGRTFILEAERVGALMAGTPVYFEGIRAGRILGSQYDEARKLVAVHAFIVQRWAGHVRETTRFFRTGGLQLSLTGGGISMGDASLASLLSGGIGFYTPEVLAGVAAGENSRFELHDSRAAAIAAAEGPHLTYLTYFPGPVRGLTPGTPVQMKGVQVGRVREVRLRYIEATATLETPVTLEIDARQLEFPVGPQTTRLELRQRMNDALSALVRRGMRATLASSLVLPGAGAVSLEMIGRAGTAQLDMSADPPIIPAAPGGDALQTALGAIGDVSARIQRLPIEQIAGDMESAARRINQLVSDPTLDRSVQRLNTALGEVERAASIAGANVEPIAQSLRNAAAAAEAAAGRVEQLVGSSVQQNYDLAQLIKELTRAAEAVRALAQYLTENPDGVLMGRRP